MFTFLSNKFKNLFDSLRGITNLDEANLAPFLESMRESLLDADVPLAVIDQFIANVKQRCLNTKIKGAIEPKEYVAKEVYNELMNVFGEHKNNKKDFLKTLINNNRKPYISLLITGLQGAGKTTTIAKIIYTLLWQKQYGIKANDILVCSVDYYRPAAQKQLQLLCEKQHVSFYNETHSKPEETAQHAMEYALKNKKKICIIDTAGRMTADEEMMKELQNIHHVIKPSASVLVNDIMSGQKGLDIAEQFTKTIPIDGVIITKVDSNAPGGIVLGIVSILQKPILYLASGEKPEDLTAFDPKRMTELLLGMGDLLALAEAADKKIASSDTQMIEKAIKQGHLDIDSYIGVFTMLKKIAPIQQIVAMIPSHMMNGSKGEMTGEKLKHLEFDSKHLKFIRDSMTKKERKVPDLVINSHTRLERIAKGCGMSEGNVEGSLSRYMGIRDMFKQMKKHFPSGMF